jgi:hypothetical protein
MDTFPPLTSVMSQELALKQGASQLQAASANLWTFSISITFPFMIHFPLLNPACYVIIVLSVLFHYLVSNFSLVLVLNRIIIVIIIIVIIIMY